MKHWITVLTQCPQSEWISTIDQIPYLVHTTTTTATTIATTEKKKHEDQNSENEEATAAAAVVAEQREETVAKFLNSCKKSNIADWVDVLNRFDTFLEQTVQRSHILQIQKPDFDQNTSNTLASTSTPTTTTTTPTTSNDNNSNNNSSTTPTTTTAVSSSSSNGDATADHDDVVMKENSEAKTDDAAQSASSASTTTTTTTSAVVDVVVDVVVDETPEPLLIQKVMSFSKFLLSSIKGAELYNSTEVCHVTCVFLDFSINIFFLFLSSQKDQTTTHTQLTRFSFLIRKWNDDDDDDDDDCLALAMSASIRECQCRGIRVEVGPGGHPTENGERTVHEPNIKLVVWLRYGLVENTVERAAVTIG